MAQRGVYYDMWRMQASVLLQRGSGSAGRGYLCAGPLLLLMSTVGWNYHHGVQCRAPGKGLVGEICTHVLMHVRYIVCACQDSIPQVGRQDTAALTRCCLLLPSGMLVGSRPLGKERTKRCTADSRCTVGRWHAGGRTGSGGASASPTSDSSGPGLWTAPGARAGPAAAASRPVSPGGGGQRPVRPGRILGCARDPTWAEPLTHNGRRGGLMARCRTLEHACATVWEFCRCFMRA